MYAWRVERFGEPSEVLRLHDDVPNPVPGPGEVRIRVRAASLNIPDDLMCRGMYQNLPNPPFTPGLEGCGIVEHCGSQAISRIGSRVMFFAKAPDGALAEFALAEDSAVVETPSQLSDVKAAAFMVSYCTAFLALHQRARIQAGESVIVHAAAGGVGSAAVQLAVGARARVIGIVSGPDKVRACRNLGADHVLDYRSGDFAEAVMELTGGKGADVVIDPVGGEILERSVDCIAWEGRIVVIGFASGKVPTIKAHRVLLKNFSILGLHAGAYRTQAPQTFESCVRALSSLVLSGVADPVVETAIDFAEASAGLMQLTSGSTIGRIVVMV
jgi:NADPH2:quinone reductase